MSLIKIALFLLVMYGIYRWIKRGVFNFLKTLVPPAANSNQTPAIDKIVPCPTCGTYNPTQVAFLMGSKFYCNQTCYNQRNQTKEKA